MPTAKKQFKVVFQFTHVVAISSTPKCDDATQARIAATTAHRDYVNTHSIIENIETISDLKPSKQSHEHY